MSQARISKALKHLYRLSTQRGQLAITHSIPKKPQALQFQRSISTTIPRHAALATSLPTQPTVVLHSPSPEHIEKEELDIELLPLEQVKLEITDRAAEQLRKISERENNQNSALRISVESGGCHGYQYKMDLAKERSPDDYQFSHPSIKPSNILVDAVSLSLLNGSTIDFATELIGSSFRVAHNPQAKGSGCGCGVSWELKE
ncbi:Iron-sulfur assembly protein 2 [Psilocybe cubensis]|uniref:Core domain-containing protein n=2 Tax=Psilocybe cubensis TaxID=181762 RepID=A0A8H7Y822_PSICU|nr:Iron-sulfur assembly protein 2 [Psilocybe cubensis]KAH9485218.1 Iron-sulfur assembly protein 2 [Psilocybe cubensis]